jgi:hypothetical protein
MLRRCLQSTGPYSCMTKLRSVCLCYESSLPMQRDWKGDNRLQPQSAALLQIYIGQPRFRLHSVTVLEPRVVLGAWSQAARLHAPAFAKPRFKVQSVTMLEPRVVLGRKRRDCMRRHVRSPAFPCCPEAGVCPHSRSMYAHAEANT